MSARIAAIGLLVALSALACSGCAGPEPLDGASFRVDVAVRGGAKRSVRIEVAPETRGLGLTKLEDRTTPDDDMSSVRRLKISTPWVEAAPRASGPPRGPNPSPAYRDHIEIATYATRPVELVFEYHGHSDVYHVSFPPGGGARLEPESGEFTHVYMKVP